MADWKGRKRKKKEDQQSLKPTLNALKTAVDELLNEVVAETYEAVERGLNKGSAYLQKKLEDATPTESGRTREQWVVDLRYRNVRYINNTSLNENRIPVVNLLEFGSRGKPFIRKTVVENQEEVLNIIKGEIENGNSR